MLFFQAQLRHLLPAERSSEVSQKYEHKGLFFPQIAENQFRAVPQRYFGVKSFVIVFAHFFYLPILNYRSPKYISVLDIRKLKQPPALLVTTA
jgi:hypothetical protein